MGIKIKLLFSNMAHRIVIGQKIKARRAVSQNRCAMGEG